jgi:hypothetical protein
MPAGNKEENLMLIEYDTLYGHYKLVVNDSCVILLGAETEHDAEQEVEHMISSGEIDLYY